MPISGTRYKPTTPNAQRPTPNVSMEAVRFEVLGVGRRALGVERSLIASSLLSISSLTVPRKPQLLEVSGQAFGRHGRGVAFGWVLLVEVNYPTVAIAS